VVFFFSSPATLRLKSFEEGQQGGQS
jgi:hypothetical protein